MSQSRTILITGCSSGIGYCVAHGLREHGYRVFASARKAEDVARLQAEGFTTVQLDLTDSNSIKAAVSEVLAQTDGELYAVFNNGAFGLAGAVEDLSRAALQAQFETNVFGTHELTRMLLPTFLKQGYGRIIQNSSVLGFAAMPLRGAYVASKFALEGLSDCLRQELRDTGVHVSLIEPGPILSRFRANSFQAYQTYIDGEHSRFKEQYQAMINRLSKEGAAVPFTLPPEAVLKRVLHALEAKRPQIRYYVTFPTYLFGFLRRILPNRAMDWVLSRV